MEAILWISACILVIPISVFALALFSMASQKLDKVEGGIYKSFENWLWENGKNPYQANNSGVGMFLKWLLIRQWHKKPLILQPNINPNKIIKENQA